MASRFRAKVFVIRGASEGIGTELARPSATPGHRLVLAARSEAALEPVSAECGRRGSKALAVLTDVTLGADGRRLMERAIEACGRIDVLVNNAGVSMHSRISEITDASPYERLWRVNGLGTIDCTRFAYPQSEADARQTRRADRRHQRAGRAHRRAGPHHLLREQVRAGRIPRCVAHRGGRGRHRGHRRLSGCGRHRNPPRRPERGRGGRAGVGGLDEAEAMPLDECARQIIRAIQGRRREWVMTRKARLGLWLKPLAPGWVDNLARKCLRQQ